jgi:hypothetical protein
MKSFGTAIVSMIIKANTVQNASCDSTSGRAGLLVPDGVKWVDLTDQIIAREAAAYKLAEERGNGPRLISGEEKAQTLAGFCDLVNRHKGSTTAISARNSGHPALVATIDYHGQSDGEKGPDPRWKKHAVTYAFPYSKQFQAWQAASNWMDKKSFLEFCQARMLDLAAPDEVAPGPVTQEILDKVLIARGGWDREQRKAASLDAVFGTAFELFDGAKKMKATTEESLEENIDDNGLISVNYKFKDSIQNAAAKRYYLLDVRVFEGDEGKLCVPVRLDLGVDNGKLRLRFELLGLDLIVENAFVKACEKVAESTGLAPIRAVF